MNKDELKCFIIYLDLSFMEHTTGLSNDGVIAYLNMQKQYPKFDDAAYRRKLAKKIFNIIDEAPDNGK